MLQSIKKMVKKLLPASWYHVDYRIKEVDRHIGDVERRIYRETSDIEKSIEDIYRYVDSLTQNVKSIDKKIDNIRKDIGSNFTDIIKRNTTEHGLMEEVRKNTNENLWAQIFNNTISQSQWLKKTEFSPGRAAVGYSFLYMLYRVLNDMRPRNLLELGLGQSTKMISQYALSNYANHFVVEHDSNWISFFKNDFTLSDRTEIVQLELTERKFLDDDKVITYKNFTEIFADKKFDFFCVDGPFGYMANIYSRIDILDLIPECLCESFVILIDDYDRKGEQRMAEELKKLLKVRDIEFSEGVYRGQKTAYIITSKDQSFLCSM